MGTIGHNKHKLMLYRATWKNFIHRFVKIMLEVNHMTSEPNEKRLNYPKQMSFITMVFWIGLFGGSFWAVMGYLAYFLGFTSIHPNMILEPWAFGSWKKEWLGTIISIILIGLFSVVVAFIYYAALKKFKGILAGLIYGVVIFLLVFFVLHPLFPSIGPFFKLSRDTIITSICLYMVYGVFVGYSISYEYENQKGTKKETAI